MQAVILAAGKGTRLRPLTNDVPKPMVLLLGKPILAHTIHFLPPEIKDIVIVVGFCGEKIKEYFGNEWEGRRIRYVEQVEYLGTAHALFTARELINSNPFLLVVGDNISIFKIPEASRQQGSYVIYSVRHQEPSRFGVLELNDDQLTLRNIQEKPSIPASNLISTGTMVLAQDIFEYDLILHPEKKEYFIPTLLMQALQHGAIVRVEEQDEWIAVDTPDDIPVAEAQLKKLLQNNLAHKA